MFSFLFFLIVSVAILFSSFFFFARSFFFLLGLITFFKSLFSYYFFYFRSWNKLKICCFNALSYLCFFLCVCVFSFFLFLDLDLFPFAFLFFFSSWDNVKVRYFHSFLFLLLVWPARWLSCVRCPSPVLSKGLNYFLTWFS